MSEDVEVVQDEPVESKENYDPNDPYNPNRWWKARRGHAQWAAIMLMVTLFTFSSLALYLDPTTLEITIPIFIANIIAQTCIVLSYVISTTYIDKLIKPFAKAVKLKSPL